MANFFKLLLAIAICQGAGFLGSFFTFSEIATWYTQLKKPSFNPPNWLFSPVWITLFTLMGISLYLVWNKGLEKKKVKTALLIFSVQLILNITWSFLFFGLHLPFYAFLEIILLWLAILATILSFLKVSQLAGLLLLPYILWVTFAAFLNFYIFLLN